MFAMDGRVLHIGYVSLLWMGECCRICVFAMDGGVLHIGSVSWTRWEGAAYRICELTI